MKRNRDKVKKYASLSVFFLRYFSLLVFRFVMPKLLLLLLPPTFPRRHLFLPSFHGDSSLGTPLKACTTKWRKDGSKQIVAAFKIDAVISQSATSQTLISGILLWLMLKHILKSYLR